MGRPVYPHELLDPDFAWLVSNFKDKRPSYQIVDVALLPVVFVDAPESDQAVEPFARETVVEGVVDSARDPNKAARIDGEER